MSTTGKLSKLFGVDLALFDGLASSKQGLRLALSQKIAELWSHSPAGFVQIWYQIDAGEQNLSPFLGRKSLSSDECLFLADKIILRLEKRR